MDGETGLLFPAGDAPTLAQAMARLITDKGLANKLGIAGQEQVKRNFQQDQIWEVLYREYVGLLQRKQPPSSLMPHTEKSGGFVAESSE
jgi:glycosyltransferase involved in cell wall biosynthesis